MRFEESGGSCQWQRLQLEAQETPYYYHSATVVTGDCPICFDTLDGPEEVQRLNCNHLFHAKCVKPWMELRGILVLTVALKIRFKKTFHSQLVFVTGTGFYFSNKFCHKQ